MMKLSIVAVSLGLAVGAVTAASAQDQSQPQGGGHGAFMQACGSDMQTYCPQAQTRDDRRACVHANRDRFSDACKSFLAHRMSHMHGQGQGGGQ